MNKKAPVHKIPLTTIVRSGTVVLFSKIESEDGVSFAYNTSPDGTSFNGKPIPIHIFDKKKEISAQSIISFKISSSGQKKDHQYSMTLEYLEDGNPEVAIAVSKDIKMWNIVSKNIPIPLGKHAILISKDMGIKNDTLYYSDREIWIKQKQTANKWKEDHILVNPRLDNFDSQPLEAMAFLKEDTGLLILYSSQSFSGDSVDMSVGAVITSYTSPGKVLWRSSTPLWSGHFDKAEYFIPLGGHVLKGNIFLYWMDVRGKLMVASIPHAPEKMFVPAVPTPTKILLKRSEKNPIISPRPDQAWETEGTFNPGVFEDEKGNVHLFYRAIGRDGISRIGYAWSKDGLHFTHRSSTPVYEVFKAKSAVSRKRAGRPLHYNPLYYTSGGSWGGAEDPRTVRIGDRAYMMYVAFEGWNSVRIALTSISMHDIEKGNWKWRHPRLISPTGEVNKNWLLFPEKIHGKYAILHSIAPKVLVEYISNIENFKGMIHSPRLHGPQPGRMDSWDNLLRGGGPPPIKTKSGWLLLYHALDKRDQGRYKLGAMILDLKDPSKVVYRSNEPILSPDMPYENEGKAGVVYASGALVKNNHLFVYYGGGDRVVCVAQAPLKKFIDYVKEGKAPKLSFSFVNLD